MFLLNAGGFGDNMMRFPLHRLKTKTEMITGGLSKPVGLSTHLSA